MGPRLAPPMRVMQRLRMGRLMALWRHAAHGRDLALRSGIF